MTGTVYLLQSGGGGPVKIGFTRLPVCKRIAQLQTGNPMPLRLIASFESDARVERHMHRAFDHIRLSGEWFSPVQEIFAAFESAAEWPKEPQTLPPVTKRGIEFLKDFVSTTRIAPRYPDGSVHSETDWDSVAIEADEAWAAYSEWTRRTAA